MKLLALLGSPRLKGNTSFLLDEYLRGIKASNKDLEITKVYLQEKHISYCNGCNICRTTTLGKCIIKDDMEDLYKEFNQSKMVVMASPIYWWGISAQLKTFLDRINAFDIEGGKYFADKMLSVLMTYELKPPNKGPEIVQATFEEICKYTKMNLIDIYSACTGNFSHIKENTEVIKEVYQLGLKVLL